MRTFKRSWRSIVMHDPCVYCAVWPNPQRAADRMTVEHVTPIALRGSRTSWENRVSAHKSCNHERGAMPLLRFMFLKHRLMTLRGRANQRARRQLRRDCGAPKTINCG